MSKKKSLGSSPVGLKSKSSTMGFIRDLGVSDSKEKSRSQSIVSSIERETEEFENSDNEKKQKEKKIVSYNLEADLIKRVKSIAKQKEMYYSSLVSMALKRWIANHQS